MMKTLLLLSVSSVATAGALTCCGAVELSLHAVRPATTARRASLLTEFMSTPPSAVEFFRAGDYCDGHSPHVGLSAELRAI